MIPCTLGIDTSCYTTSLALASEGAIVASVRRLLTVEQGERGLQQSKGVFQHVNRLPELFDQLLAEAPEARIDAVCVSARPRDQEGSYMPVFVAGHSFARGIAAALRVPLYETSHQQGHVRAALVDSSVPEGGPFLALHLSGGTTEVLSVQPDLSITLLGGSGDLNAGQLVDRVGVALGLGFPAGPALEALAVKGEARSAFPLAASNGSVSFSGAEAQAMRLIKSGTARPEDIAAEVYSYLARAVARLIRDGQAQTGAKHVLVSGGVASSALLRTLLPARLKRQDIRIGLHWGRPELSGDNACGVALIGDAHKRTELKHGR